MSKVMIDICWCQRKEVVYPKKDDNPSALKFVYTCRDRNEIIFWRFLSLNWFIIELKQFIIAVVMSITSNFVIMVLMKRKQPIMNVVVQVYFFSLSIFIFRNYQTTCSAAEV